MTRLALLFALGLFGLLGATAPVAAQTSQDAPMPEPAEWLRLPCAMEAPAPGRPLQPDSLRVTTAATPQSVLAECRESLAGVVDYFAAGQPSAGSGLLASISEHLALFPWRFGMRPQRAVGWDELSAAAREVLADVEADPPRLDLSREDSNTVLFRVLLLQLAGREDEADERLGRTVGGHVCGSCAQQSIGVILQRRSERAEQRGDSATALQLLEELVRATIDHRAGMLNDISATRMGLLLCTSGRQLDGLCLLQQVVDLMPDTLGAETATAVLEQVGALRPPTPARVRRIYVDGLPEHDARRELAERWLKRAEFGPPIPPELR